MLVAIIFDLYVKKTHHNCRQSQFLQSILGLLYIQVYEALLEKMTPFIAYEERPLGNPPVSPDKQLLIFLWYISNQASMREMGRMFGVSRFTVRPQGIKSNVSTLRRSNH